jgi:hypothetical protein
VNNVHVIHKAGLPGHRSRVQGQPDFQRDFTELKAEIAIAQQAADN